jgi:hypothetical protein
LIATISVFGDCRNVFVAFDLMYQLTSEVDASSLAIKEHAMAALDGSANAGRETRHEPAICAAPPACAR